MSNMFQTKTPKVAQVDDSTSPWRGHGSVFLHSEGLEAKRMVVEYQLILYGIGIQYAAPAAVSAQLAYVL